MFDISWGKLVIIGVVALLVIGPKELPGVLRQLGQAMAKLRRMAAEFQGQFNEAMREAEMGDLKKQFDETTSSLSSAVASMTSSLDPTGIKNDLEKMIQDPGADPVTDSTKDPMPQDSLVATSTPATPPSDPTAPLPTPATATPEATPPSDPLALGTAPASPEIRAPEVDVPMPEMPAPVDSRDFAESTPTAPTTPAAPAPKPEGDKAA